MKWLDFALHCIRLVVGLALLMLLGPLHPLLAVAFSLSVYLVCFAFAHDVAHGSLSLPRGFNEVVLSLSALPMAVSGHSMRLMHLRHHARPLTEGDLEGVGAGLSLWSALLIGPMNAFELRREAFRISRRKERYWVVVESIVSMALLSAAIMSHSPVLRVWAMTAIVLALGASAWASHLPHHPPKWLRRLALTLTWTGSPALLSFAFHEEHHAQPKIPCSALGYRNEMNPTSH